MNCGYYVQCSCFWNYLWNVCFFNHYFLVLRFVWITALGVSVRCTGFAWLSDCLEQCHPTDANSRLATLDISRSSWNPISRVYHLLCARWIQSASYNSISLKFFLILFSHLRLNIQWSCFIIIIIQLQRKTAQNHRGNVV